MQKLFAGAVAGSLAAAPMGVAMKALQQTAPSARWQSLPPRQITVALARRVGLAHRLDRDARSAATTAAHFGYGGAVGALYPYASRALPGPTPMKGALFGVGLWAASYLGWLPAAGILRPATREPAGRNAMMILAHVVWGAATAIIAERLIEAPGEGERSGEQREASERDADTPADRTDAPLPNSRLGES